MISYFSSHSERSLLEITKRGSEGTSDNNLSTSVPSASALSLMMESEGTGEPVRGGIFFNPLSESARINASAYPYMAATRNVSVVV